MALERELLDLPCAVSPNAASGIAQFTAVTLDTAGSPFDVIQAAANTTFPVGISQDMGDQLTVGSSTPPVVASPESTAVRFLGVSKAQASAAITVGQSVVVANASGQLGPAPAAGATDVYIVGVALTPATAAGDLFTVLLTPGATTQVSA